MLGVVGYVAATGLGFGFAPALYNTLGVFPGLELYRHVVNIQGTDQLLSELVRIDSQNPDLVPGAPGERAIAEFCVQWFQRNGIDACPVLYSSDGGVQVVLIDQAGGDLSFLVTLSDTTRLPQAIVRQVAGPDDELPLKAPDGVEIRWIYRGGRADLVSDDQAGDHAPLGGFHRASPSARPSSSVERAAGKAAIRSISESVMPASFGVPGPGEMTRWVASISRASSRLISSLVRTTTSAPRMRSA